MSPTAVLHDVPANAFLAMFPSALVFAMFYANLMTVLVLNPWRMLKRACGSGY